MKIMLIRIGVAMALIATLTLTAFAFAYPTDRAVTPAAQCILLPWSPSGLEGI